MASIVMVIGQSGTGKSTSLRNFKTYQRNLCPSLAS